MITRWILRSSIGLLSGAAIGALTALTAATTSVLTAQPAFAQPQPDDVSLEFRDALEPYGQWVEHRRWGEVWIPEDVPPDWRPYKFGQWVYTDEWGWYWVADEEWGWIPYHYGRWVLDRQVGWLWVPGQEWGPAWVRWRRGSEVVGWAPLPPDDIIFEDEVDLEPDYWAFVPLRSLTASRVSRFIVPPPQRVIYIRNTVVVNRTVVVQRDRRLRFAVNPGIPPAFIAAAVGRPLRVVSVRPRVLTGTRGVEGAREVRIDEVRRERGRQDRQFDGKTKGGDRPRGFEREAIVERTTGAIQPARSVPPPQALPRGERGRLGDNPPRAARGATPAEPAPTQQRRGAPDDQGRPAGPSPTGRPQTPDAAPQGAPAASPQGAPAAPPQGAPAVRDDDRGRRGQQRDTAPPQSSPPPASSPPVRSQERQAPASGATPPPPSRTDPQQRSAPGAARPSPEPQRRDQRERRDQPPPAAAPSQRAPAPPQQATPPRAPSPPATAPTGRAAPPPPPAAAAPARPAAPPPPTAAPSRGAPPPAAAPEGRGAPPPAAAPAGRGAPPPKAPQGRKPGAPAQDDDKPPAR